MKKILEVEETFLLEGRGLVVAPQIPVSQNCVFIPFQAMIELVCPDGTSTTCHASFQLTHSRLYTGESGFRIDISLLDVPKQQVPIGTQIYGSDETFNVLFSTTKVVANHK